MTPNSFDQDPRCGYGGSTLCSATSIARASLTAGMRFFTGGRPALRDGYFVLHLKHRWSIPESWIRYRKNSRVSRQSVSRVQCQGRCSEELFPFPETLVVDLSSRRALEPLPGCPRCGGLARPNVLMFYDFSWIGIGMNRMHDAMDAWLSSLPADSNLVVFEVGAGVAVPSVRVCGEAAGLRDIRLLSFESIPTRVIWMARVASVSS